MNSTEFSTAGGAATARREKLVIYCVFSAICPTDDLRLRQIFVEKIRVG
jgi:hypothetical protein